ncbi:hypothetical protein ACH47Z_39965 [Streptomyces sp. NPDC020192]|uniref:hypothetical protein n=1 Tax=Streptomyces sp. NPDC020192 TaxID=3365066 RepID=UPI00378FDB08
MPPIPVKPGTYEIDGTILGGRAVVTAGEHASEHGVPLITNRPLYPPFQQTWTIEPLEPIPGSAYVIRLTHHEQTGIVTAEDKLWVDNVPRQDWAKFTFEPALGGFHVLSDNGLALRLVRPGAQIELAPPKQEPQELWHLTFRPFGDE